MAARLFYGGQVFNPVQAADGNMMLPLCFMLLGFAELCRMIIQHPKWRRPMVLLTSLLCVVFFGIQIQVNWTWRHVVDRVQAFSESHSSSTLIARYPIYQRVETNMLPRNSLFVMNVAEKVPQFTIDAWDSENGKEDGVITVRGVSVEEFVDMLSGYEYQTSSFWKLKASADQVDFQRNSDWIFIASPPGRVRDFKIQSINPDGFTMLIRAEYVSQTPLAVLDL
jgi:hypothetical protein